MISDKHKCIFVHIPRTGGSSIETVLWPRKEEKDLWQGFTSRFNNEYQTDGLQHLYARNIRKAVGDRFDRYFKFTIVRNPWDKAVSSYAHAKKTARLKEFLDIDFDIYVGYHIERVNTVWIRKPAIRSTFALIVSRWSPELIIEDNIVDCNLW